MKRKTAGILYGAMGAVCYGTNPIFALNLYQQGLKTDSVLFYRYLTAVIIFGIWTHFFKKISLKIQKNEILPLFIMGILFALSSVTLFNSYLYIDAGVAYISCFCSNYYVFIFQRKIFKNNNIFNIISYVWNFSFIQRKIRGRFKFNRIIVSFFICIILCNIYGRNKNSSYFKTHKPFKVNFLHYVIWS